MPRYFFDVHDSLSMIDVDGTELPDLEAARHEAVRLVGALLKDDPSNFWNGEYWSVEVSDARRMVLFALHFHATGAPATSGAAGPEPSAP